MKDVIKKTRKDHKMSLKAFASKLHVAPTTVSAWERGVNTPRMNKITEISEKFNVPIYEFFSEYKDKTLIQNEEFDPLTVQQVPKKSDDYRGHNQNQLIAEKDTPYNCVQLPFYESIAAGALSILTDIIDQDLQHITIPKQLLNKTTSKDELLAMNLHSDSMNNIIPNGAIIICKRANFKDLNHGDIVIVNVKKEISLRRFCTDEQKHLFQPDTNRTNYETIEVLKEAESEIMIIGKVISYCVTMDEL
ncbi:XRE family transcriptional regulator [Geomicrobium sp. JCM 19038]|uniref:helix-turn-helix domain-containing protein n=1 Tax=Geomicrobium sp. JCM 19038 TaxID=1460635 RepID=UPI00045F4409|nr:XRE family transcriptional regulator [Geomicrobium sp. JCM 19038]GAK08019.1 LexA repressor [Geomicrobium sp. JCM 19038]